MMVWITWTFTTVAAGLFAILVFQRMTYPFFWEDFIYYLNLRKVGKALKSRMQRGVITYLDSFLYQAKKTPDKAFIVFDSQTLTYQDVDKRSNQFAKVFRTEGGLKKGDIVALLMSNEPDFICVWFGLSKLGCEVAFLNFNIKSKSLLYCFESCGAKSLVENAIEVWVTDIGCPHEGVNTLLDKVEQASDLALPDSPRADLMSNFLQFWKDCVKYNVTVFQYVGELCRYLVNQPVVPEERVHKVRVAAGSGLRADVWREFARRFGKINVREAYGLTEASIGFVNYTNEIGPIGRAGYFNKLNMPFEFLSCDPQTYEPIRTAAGRCVKANKEKKLLRDVFKEGDVYFNTGDLMLQDHRDFVYFRDRIGDTFRWKGENVATTEVSEILGSLEFLQEVNVYGVTVPAVVLKIDKHLDGKKLYNHLVQSLPTYSWPWFLRIQTSIDVTETFKQQKKKLVQEGFSPEAVQESLYFLDLSQRDYVPLTQSLHDDIVSGKIRL
ncbi:unnamed protein product [Coregonus sp. 'balchen']|nr:unnamed protein product [Coregonus sp. 'balchen']